MIQHPNVYAGSAQIDQLDEWLAQETALVSKSASLRELSLAGLVV